MSCLLLCGRTCSQPVGHRDVLLVSPVSYHTAASRYAALQSAGAPEHVCDTGPCCFSLYFDGLATLRMAVKGCKVALCGVSSVEERKQGVIVLSVSVPVLDMFTASCQR